MAEKKEPLSEGELIELEWKRMQIEEMRERMDARRDRRERLEALRKKQFDDFHKAQAIIANRQRVCKHRKGGRDNRFAKGDGNAYSIIQNTYPNGTVTISCTRCAKEVTRPDPRTRRTDPKGYAAAKAEWDFWNDLPTDNTPSGGKIFEVIAAA